MMSAAGTKKTGKKPVSRSLLRDGQYFFPASCKRVMYVLILFVLQGHHGLTAVVLEFEHTFLLHAEGRNLSESSEHGLFGVHVLTHHTCASKRAEIYLACLHVGVERTCQTVAARAAIYAVLVCVETDERSVVVVAHADSLALHFCDVPFTCEC